MLSHLEGITVILQSTSLDIIKGFHLVEEVKVLYNDLRETADGNFFKIYDQAVRFAEKVEVQPDKSRMAERMEDRATAPADNVKHQFLQNITIPLRDHVISGLEARFPSLSVTPCTLLSLATSVLCVQEVDIAAAVEKNNGDLSST